MEVVVWNKMKLTPEQERELLELAAKAAGYEVVAPLHRGEDSDFYAIELLINNEYFEWNPIHSRGDALELAVKLGIRVTPYPVYEFPKTSVIADIPTLHQ